MATESLSRRGTVSQDTWFTTPTECPKHFFFFLFIFLTRHLILIKNITHPQPTFEQIISFWPKATLKVIASNKSGHHQTKKKNQCRI